MQSVVDVLEGPRVGSAHRSVDPVNDPTGPVIRKKLVLFGLPVTAWSTAGSPRKPAGAPGGHFRNGAASAPSVWSKTPSGVNEPMSWVSKMPRVPASAVNVFLPYGLVTV